MGHYVQALVFPTALSNCVGERFRERIAELEQGLSLAPITDDVLDRLASKEGVGGVEPFERLTESLIAFARGLSKHAPVAYLETEYFGGAGTQAAIAWSGGEEILIASTGDGAVNAALRAIGARKGGSHDEFDEIGIGRFRDNESWVEAGTEPG